MSKLRQHNIVLTSYGGNIRLRPMTESDWHILLPWNSDPEVLYYSEGDDVAAYSLEDVQGIYRGVSQIAFCFIIEANGKPIGECWLQEMNLERIFSKYPGLDCRRIDIMIGEKQYWGQGIGTEVIRMLTKFGFLNENADMIFCCSIANYNVRSLRAVQKVGYRLLSKMKEKPGAKADYTYDFVLTKEEFYAGNER